MKKIILVTGTSSGLGLSVSIKLAEQGHAVYASMHNLNKAEPKSGQIINITSVGGLIGQPFNEIYCASKFAVEGFTESMASYIQPFFNIKFTAIEPGGIVSEFSTNVMKNSIIDFTSTDDEYAPIFKQYFEDARNRLKNASELDVYQSSDQVADCVIEVVNGKNPPLRIRTSEWAENFCKLKTQSDPMGTKSVATVYKLFLAPETETDKSVI